MFTACAHLSRPARILTGILALVWAADLGWGLAGGFAIVWRDYLVLLALAGALALGGLFYVLRRPDRSLAAMLLGTGFLVAFSAGANLLNSLLLTVAGTRIDAHLAAIDRAMGFDWPALMGWAAAHPAVNTTLLLAYGALLPQVALLMAALGLARKPDTIYALCLSVALSALLIIGVWTLWPAFGAFSVYGLPPATASRLTLALDGAYARSLVDMLAHGPGVISPGQVQGLIGFPSYHALLAILAGWYARALGRLGWPMIALDVAIVLATPVQGGHHLIDVVAGAAAAAMVVALVARLASRADASGKNPAACAAGSSVLPQRAGLQ